jgi:hypothetical protein
MKLTQSEQKTIDELSRIHITYRGILSQVRNSDEYEFLLTLLQDRIIARNRRQSER